MDGPPIVENIKKLGGYILRKRPFSSGAVQSRDIATLSAPPARIRQLASVVQLKTLLTTRAAPSFVVGAAVAGTVAGPVLIVGGGGAAARREGLARFIWWVERPRRGLPFSHFVADSELGHMIEPRWEYKPRYC